MLHPQTMLTDERAAWLRQPYETAKAFDAASRYFQQGPTRSCARVAQELGKSRTLMMRWSSRWEWGERAAAYDDMLEQVRLQKVADVVAAVTERHARVLQAALSVASVLPRCVLEVLQDSSQLQGLITAAKSSPAALLRLLSEARPFLICVPSLIETERLIHGLPTEDVVVEERRTASLEFTEKLLANPDAVDHLVLAVALVAGTGEKSAPDLKGGIS